MQEIHVFLDEKAWQLELSPETYGETIVHWGYPLLHAGETRERSLWVRQEHEIAVLAIVPAQGP
jgi:hypothetical protein